MAIGLTRQQLQARTKVIDLKEENDEDTIQYWISVAEALLEPLDLDTSVAGYTVNMLFVVQKLTEHLWINNDEQVVVAANTPFASQRLGSFSYRLQPAPDKISIFSSMPPIIQAIIKRYTKNPKQLAFTTPVFPQVDADSVGLVEYHDFLDAVTQKDRDLFNLADIVGR